MAASLHDLPRKRKQTIVQQIHDLLVLRKKKGPAEPALDGWIAPLAALSKGLAEHVEGKTAADADRRARQHALFVADVEVDTWLRHVEAYLRIEAHRAFGEHVAAAAALHEAAFPDGLAHIDDPPADENAHCRDSLAMFAAPGHAKTIAAIGLPKPWLTTLATALDQSDAAILAIAAAKDDGSSHVALGRDIEADWVDAMVRLRQYVSSRAAKSDVAARQEGKRLLRPLLDAIAGLRNVAATRATQRATQRASAHAAAAPPPPPDAAKA